MKTTHFKSIRNNKPDDTPTARFAVSAKHSQTKANQQTQCIWDVINTTNRTLATKTNGTQTLAHHKPWNVRRPLPKLDVQCSPNIIRTNTKQQTRSIWHGISIQNKNIPKGNTTKSNTWTSSTLTRPKTIPELDFQRSPNNIKTHNQKQQTQSIRDLRNTNNIIISNENKRKSNTWTSSQLTGPMTFPNPDFQCNPNSIKTKNNKQTQWFGHLRKTTIINSNNENSRKSNNWKSSKLTGQMAIPKLDFHCSTNTIKTNGMNKDKQVETSEVQK